jgi:Tfp pilus assembly protein PilO
MRRNALLGALGAILLVALYYMLLFQPAREEIAATRATIATVETEQTAIQAEIARLQVVREGAPEVEADLALARAIVPDEAASPSLLRQLQLGATDSELVLTTVTLGRPAESLTDPTLASLAVSVQLEGTYFQVVDFLRRIETPDITPRGVIWDSVAVTPTEYPLLSVNLSGRTFADAVGAIETPPEAEVPEAAEGEPVEGEAAEGEEGADGDEQGDGEPSSDEEGDQ